MVSRRFTSAIHGSYLYGELVCVLDEDLRFLLYSTLNVALNHCVLAGRVQALQNENALLLEVVSQCLLLPPLHANHLVFDLVNGILVPLQSHLGQHRSSPRVLLRNEVACHRPEPDKCFGPVLWVTHLGHHID